MKLTVYRVSIYIHIKQLPGCRQEGMFYIHLDFTVCIGYLDNPVTSNVNLDVRCNSHDQFVGWSLSPNGTEPDAKLIDTSLPKYTRNGNTLRIHGVNASDEGLYRCVYATGKVPRLCILVHGKSAQKSIVHKL